ncbi:plant transposon protein [Nitzschia inconspicua]|uniref:Plant transposon protein n=1 Tax=Nitzschia inconspicua TaxID=303405 RepID=A0A9K3PB47_9STRA|nr:plant transposon protein [Nitzschia inconspicua]KAG7367827.1 plant transposon protein [Nitzschia inconspicua]
MPKNTSDSPLLRSILQLHRHVHQVDGLFGSLDCSHTIWKNCPKAWAGSYTGKPGSPSIILEAVVDYHMFFWHASYGYTGNIGDLNVLAQSPTWQFLDRPILKLKLSEVAMRTTCCIILHNMLTADRVMGDPRARYVPCASLDECPGVGAVQQPGDLAAVQGIANIANDPTHAAAGAAAAPANSGTGLQIGLRNAPQICYNKLQETIDSTS